VILAGLGATDPGRHPLALTVPHRAMTALLAWPLTGQPPRQLATARADLAAGHAEITAALREAADQAEGDGERAAMLRRQERFLLAQADDPAARQWAASTQARDLRTPGDLRQWTPRWAAARSAAHVAATAGNLDPLHRFIDQGLSDDRLISANLSYWAYWAGEAPAPWNADSAMTRPAADTWNGTLLLGTLMRGIVHAPCAPTPYGRSCCCDGPSSPVPGRSPRSRRRSPTRSRREPWHPPPASASNKSATSREAHDDAGQRRPERAGRV
jgi:hypothetical protein